MSKSVGEVAIVVNADLGPMNRELGRAEGGLKGFERSALSMGNLINTTMGKVTVGVGVAAAGMVALTRSSMMNIDALAKQARSIGLTVSAFQKMSLVANEAGVETGKLTSMIGVMQRNIEGLVQGTAAQTAAFDRLGLALSDLQGLSADEQFARIAEALDKISDPAKKTALAMDVFGRSGRETINMLSGYSEAIASASEFNARFGISVSEDTAGAVERANDAVGRLGMVFEGLGNRMAGVVAGPIEATANGMLAVAEAMLGVRTNVEEFFGSLEAAKAALGEDIFNQLMGSPEDVAASGQALSDIAYRMEEFKRLGFEAGGAIQELHATVYRLDEVAASAFDGILMRMEQLRQQLADGTIDAEEFATEMGKLGEQALNLALDLEQVNGVTFGPAISALAALGATIRDRIAEALGLRSALSDALAGDEEEAFSYDGPVSSGRGGPGGPVVGSTDLAELQAGGGVYRTMPEPTGGRGGGGRGGGGLADKFAQRLAIIIDAMKTEQEVIEEWYEESRALIEQASEDELAALGGKHEALERLEEEHQRRMKAIKDMGNQWSVDSVLQGGEEILSAMGSMNKKAMKAAGVVSAAQALISTYEGAAAELKKGTFGFASAAAVIAKGLGFVAAIKSAASGGEGGAGGGRGGAAVTQSAPPVQRMLIDYRGPEAAFPSFSALVDMMNQAGKAGYVLNAQITGRS